MEIRPICDIKPLEMILVFGSGLDGKNGRGDALDAVTYWGADTRVKAGASGQAWAVPVRGVKGDLLSIREIAKSVTKLIRFASRSKETFFVSRIGCEPGAYAPEQIAPMFKDAPANMILPGVFLSILGRLNGNRVVVVGSLGNHPHEAVFDVLDAEREPIEKIIVMECKSVSIAASQWAAKRGVRVISVSSPWVELSYMGCGDNDEADDLQDEWLLQLGTRLINFRRGPYRRMKSLAITAKARGLSVEVCDLPESPKIT